MPDRYQLPPGKAHRFRALVPLHGFRYPVGRTAYLAREQLAVAHGVSPHTIRLEPMRRD